MPTIAEHLGQNPPVFTAHADFPAVGAVGFEVELENTTVGWPNVQGWQKVEDGSLRDGIEYIFRGPASGVDIRQRIDAFAAALDGNVDPTFRCSTHIHLDIRDLDWMKYERTVLAYMVYEDLFFDHCMERRRHSNFCTPFLANDWLAQRFGEQVIGGRNDAHKFAACQQWPKYSAFNLQPTARYGSIEFRGGHAMTTVTELNGMAQRMLHLKTLAAKWPGVDHYEFVQNVRALPLDQAFPTGLREGYQVHEGGLDQGVASALHAILAGAAAQAGRSAGRNPAEGLPEFLRQRADAPRETSREIIRQLGARRVDVNRTYLRQFNLEYPAPRALFSQVAQMVTGVNRVNGLNVDIRQVVNGGFAETHWGLLNVHRAEFNAMFQTRI